MKTLVLLMSITVITGHPVLSGNWGPVRSLVEPAQYLVNTDASNEIVMPAYSRQVAVHTYSSPLSYVRYVPTMPIVATQQLPVQHRTVTPMQVPVQHHTMTTIQVPVQHRTVTTIQNPTHTLIPDSHEKYDDDYSHEDMDNSHEEPESKEYSDEDLISTLPSPQSPGAHRTQNPTPIYSPLTKSSNLNTNFRMVLADSHEAYDNQFVYTLPTATNLRTNLPSHQTNSVPTTSHTSSGPLKYTGLRMVPDNSNEMFDDDFRVLSYQHSVSTGANPSHHAASITSV